MLCVNDQFPEFSLNSSNKINPSSDDSNFSTVKKKDLLGHWSLVFFYPMDFTFICPTEIAGFENVLSDFTKNDCKVYGVSCDSHFSHAAWRKRDPELVNVSFPLLSDFNKKLSKELGILNEDESYSLRATFILDPKGKIRSVTVYDDSIGRSPEESLRCLMAVQTGKLCPVNWSKGKNFLN